MTDATDAAGRSSDADSTVESRFRSLFDGLDGSAAATAREVVEESETPWYANLLADTVDTVSETDDAVDASSVRAAGSAVELLWGYYRVRGRLLVQLSDARAHSLTMDSTAALLAGDYLHAAAYSSISSVSSSHLGSCVERLNEAARGLVGTFRSAERAPVRTEAEVVSYCEDTAGRLGETASALGSMLADADEPQRRLLGRVGREASVARQLRRICESDPAATAVSPPECDESLLRERAARRRDDALDALRELPGSVDRSVLRASVGRPE
ncbi:hypothetical protein C457_09354 [Haloferax prahovense DSM 18310]|uniref:Polyprenyl synthetase n=1 Tax=Haloferax prahovense (strain DSM 18310 / JCM 13924 / TL6) TaxID=1227461 RepID=M0GCM5_HALPT|nr:hypothetical protein [Haloferax prahovense]ELZ69328.1 hypothetical protein C457_09354 [Haloferax prahovense DSM 18310]